MNTVIETNMLQFQLPSAVPSGVVPATQFHPAGPAQQSYSGPSAPTDFQTINFNQQAQPSMQQQSTVAPVQFNPAAFGKALQGFTGMLPIYYIDKDDEFLSMFFPCMIIGTISFDYSPSLFIHLVKKILHLLQNQQAMDFLTNMLKPISHTDKSAVADAHKNIFTSMGNIIIQFMQNPANHDSFSQMFYHYNILKFGQNPELFTKLAETGTKKIYYCNQGDFTYGTGYNVETSKTVGNGGNPNLRAGRNLFGAIIETIRKDFTTNGVPSWATLSSGKKDENPQPAQEPLNVSIPETVLVLDTVVNEVAVPVVNEVAVPDPIAVPVMDEVV